LRWWNQARKISGKVANQPRQRGGRRLTLEYLEDRTVLSTVDGSFHAVMLDSMRNDPQFAGIDGSGIGIANIDSGIYAQNPDLQANVKVWFDAANLNNNPASNDPNYAADSLQYAFDPEGHGSHTAGIEASSNPDIGVAYNASLIAVRGLPGPP
jgi:subtilisin family serine protease